MFKQNEFETDKFKFKAFSPELVIDCNHSANVIGKKDFEDAYENGELIVIDAYKDENGVPITDPIKRVESVHNLIRECQNNKTIKSLFIDGFDAVEWDARYYIYKKFRIEEREDGTLWYKEKESWNKKTQSFDIVPEHEVGGITQLMYGPRTTQLKKILVDITNMSIPVFISSHVSEDYDKKTGKATGLITSNLRDFIVDDMTYVARVETINLEEIKMVNGRQIMENIDKRKLIVINNRFQKGKSPVIKTYIKDGFEFTDIFNTMIKEEL